MRIFVSRLALVALAVSAMAPLSVAAITDSTPPVVSSVTPITATLNQATTYEVTTSDDVAGVAGCDLYVNTVNQGAMTMSLISGMSWRATRAYTYTGAAGTISVYARCRDAAAIANYTNGATTTVTISTPGVMSAVSPTTAVVGMATTFSASYSSFTAPNTLESCWLIVDGATVYPTMTQSGGVGSVSGTVSKSHTFAAVGAHILRVSCLETTGGGKVGPDTTINVSAPDTTPPVVSNLQPTTATKDMATTISVTATDNMAIDKCFSTIDGVVTVTSMGNVGSTYSESRTFTTLGSHSISVSCRDFASPANTTVVSGTVVVTNPDITAPVVSNLQPTSATQNVATTLSVTATDNVAIFKCNSTIDGVVTVTSMGNVGSTYSESRTFTTVGSHSISVSCNDTASPANSTVVSGTVGVIASPAADITLPTVVGVGPTTASTGSAVTVTATVADNVGISACTLFVAGTSQGVMTVSSGVASRSHTFAVAGNYSVEVRCTDAASNAGTSSSTVTVSAPPAADATLPVVGQVAQTAATAGTAIMLSVAASDNIGISSCTLYVGGVSQGTMAVSGSSASLSHTFSSSGNIAVEARCTDATGNIGIGVSRSIAVAAAGTTPPPPTPIPISTGSDADSDGDDLADADETLYGTSTTNRDTDGDGFADGTEVRNGFNPLGAGNISPPTTSAVPGRLIKLACPAGANGFHACKAVYYYGRDGKRHPFPSARIYLTWFYNFATVQIVDAAFMASLPVGKNVLPRPGVRLVKFDTVNTVYAVGRGGILRGIVNESVAASIYGSTWTTKIDDVVDTLFGNFLIGADITSFSDYSPTASTAGTTSIDGSF